MWLKYFPWKDLYERKLKAPYIPKNQDNFDEKYCNIADKIGQQTQMRYDQILIEHSKNNIFKDFYFYYNELEPNSVLNSKEKKFNNPHEYYLSTNTQLAKNIIEEKEKENIDKKINFDSKYVKMRNLSTSGSTGNIFVKKVINIPNNSNNNGSSSTFKRTSSVTNMRY